MKLPPPNLLGGPEKFDAWRAEQIEAINHMSETSSRFLGLCMPTGTGKSLAGVMGTVLQGARAVVLTSTKALQDQYLRDFEEIGMVDVRGMGNYECRPDILHDMRYPKGTKVDRAPCRAGYRCIHMAASGCDYYDTVNRGMMSPLVVTNYAFWLRQQIEQPALGKPEFLVLDEAHAAPDEVAEAMRVRLYEDEITQHLGRGMPGLDEPMSEWCPWLHRAAAEVTTRAKQAVEWLHEADSWDANTAEGVRRLRDLAMRLTRASIATVDNWVVLPAAATGRHKRKGVDIAPIWPRELTEPYLFRGIERVVLLSATMRPKTAELLGIDASDLEWREWDSGFPVKRRPVIQLKGARMRYTMSQFEFRKWATTIQQIVISRREWKGIIHTVSYRRATELIDLIGESCEEAGVTIFMHDPGSTARAIEEFKRHQSGAVLVSPVVSTGYDFPFEQCMYQIVGKVPWPDTRDPVTKARLAQDKQYGAYVALHEIVQMAGRGMRAPDDYCETWIVDDFFSVLAFAPKTRGLLPKAFTRALVRRQFVEAAPEVRFKRSG